MNLSIDDLLTKSGVESHAQVFEQRKHAAEKAFEGFLKNIRGLPEEEQRAYLSFFYRQVLTAMSTFNTLLLMKCLSPRTVADGEADDDLLQELVRETRDILEKLKRPS